MAGTSLRDKMFKMYCLDEETYALFSAEEKVELIKKTIMETASGKLIFVNLFIYSTCLFPYPLF